MNWRNIFFPLGLLVGESQAFQARPSMNDQLLRLLLQGDSAGLDANRRRLGPPGNSSSSQKSLAYFVWMICVELYDGSSSGARSIFMSLDKSPDTYQTIKNQFQAWAKEHPRRVEIIYGQALSEWLPSPTQDFTAKRDNLLRAIKLLNSAVVLNEKLTPVLDARYGAAAVLSAYGDREAGTNLQAYAGYKNQKETLLTRPPQAKGK